MGGTIDCRRQREEFAVPGTDTQTSAIEVARGYFGAIESGDRSAQRTWYHRDAVLTLQGIFEGAGRDEAIAWFDDLYAAFPDLRFEVLDLVGDDDVAAVHWRLEGTFAGRTGTETFLGFQPTGARVVTRGCDVIRAHDGLVASVRAYTDGMTIARQLGAMPPQDSAAERGLARALNVRTRLLARLLADDPLEVADGVWRIRGGVPRKVMNVYAIRDGDGILFFDTGVRQMTSALRLHAARLGGLTRIVLGHGHVDHRGAAPALGVPVHAHPAEVAMAASSDGGSAKLDLSGVSPVSRALLPRLVALWDGGPVTVDATLQEGDEIAGFRVVHLPGHSDGQIGLWREGDRLALTSDCFYCINLDTLMPSGPRLPPPALGATAAADVRASIRKLAALEPAAVWPGHGEPLRGDVRARLERLAEG
jgi:hydroxyacylglutathione hydrolase